MTYRPQGLPEGGRYIMTIRHPSDTAARIRNYVDLCQLTSGRYVAMDCGAIRSINQAEAKRIAGGFEQ